jgi:hypothetical protein
MLAAKISRSQWKVPELPAHPKRMPLSRIDTIYVTAPAASETALLNLAVISIVQL